MENNRDEQTASKLRYFKQRGRRTREYGEIRVGPRPMPCWRKACDQEVAFVMLQPGRTLIRDRNTVVKRGHDGRVKCRHKGSGLFAITGRYCMHKTDIKFQIVLARYIYTHWSGEVADRKRTIRRAI